MERILVTGSGGYREPPGEVFISAGAVSHEAEV